MTAPGQSPTLAVLLTAVISCAWNVMSLHAEERHDPEVLEVAEIEGRLVGYFVGDYVHAAFCTPGDSLVSFMLYGNVDADYFVASHVGTQMQVTYQVLKYGVREAGDEPILVLAGARIGELRSSTWWANVIAGMGHDRATDAYEALVTALTTSYDKITCK